MLEVKVRNGSSKQEKIICLIILLLNINHIKRIVITKIIQKLVKKDIYLDKCWYLNNFCFYIGDYTRPNILSCQ